MIENDDANFDLMVWSLPSLSEIMLIMIILQLFNTRVHHTLVHFEFRMTIGSASEEV